jgi:hypothetical protein
VAILPVPASYVGFGNREAAELVPATGKTNRQIAKRDEGRLWGRDGLANGN